MKFQLFGRLREDQETGPEEGQTGLSGGSLERTVENMFQQGYSEEEIKNELQGRYTSTEISQAVNNTVTSSATNSNGPQPMTPYQSDTEQDAVSPMDEGYSSEPEQQEMQEENGFGQAQDMPQEIQRDPQPQFQQPQEQLPQESQQQRSHQSGTVDPAVEELIETIVAEQFERVRNEFDSVYSELDVLIEEVEGLENRVHDLEIRDDEDQEQFVQKVDEMEDHIDSYQSRIGGLEKAFQQVLPSLVQNVKELTSLVQEIKEEKGIETSTQISEEVDEDIDMSDW